MWLPCPTAVSIAKPQVYGSAAGGASPDTGVVIFTGQKAALGRLHTHRMLIVTVSDITLAIDLGHGDVRVVSRTNKLAGPDSGVTRGLTHPRCRAVDRARNAQDPTYPGLQEPTTLELTYPAWSNRRRG
jgi:hypothetical protein